jgi:hypothetical protein
MLGLRFADNFAAKAARMAIVDLDKGMSRRPRRGDGALIAALGGAILIFAVAMWTSAPHPTVTPVAPPRSSQDVSSITTISRSGVLVTTPNPSTLRNAGPVPRPLALPSGLDSVDLFLVPERITNENLIWTMRSVVQIRGGIGLASIEGPSIVTWTEKGFQYWMVSPTRTTDELIKIADDLR